MEFVRQISENSKTDTSLAVALYNILSTTWPFQNLHNFFPWSIVLVDSSVDVFGAAEKSNPQRNAYRQKLLLLPVSNFIMVGLF